MKTSIIFHKGLYGNGVVIELRHGHDRLIFDFGAPFLPNHYHHDKFLKERANGNLRDDLRQGRTPAINGIYKAERLLMPNGQNIMSLEPYSSNSYSTYVLISHLHKDHMENIDYLDEAIPVYMSKEAKALNEVLINLNDGKHHQNIIGVDLHETFYCGPFKCTPYFSDHPCFGSIGYLIEVDDQTIYYSGDVRFHGLQHERAFKEMELLGEKNVDLLILDSSSYSPDKFYGNRSSIASTSILEGQFSEEGIYNDLGNKLKQNEQLCAFNIYHRDLQLIKALLKTAQDAKREIVFEVETAYVISKLLHEPISYYIGDYQIDEVVLKEVQANNKEVKIEDLNKQPNQYFVQVSYENLLSMNSLKIEDGLYFQLFGEPFGNKRGLEILRQMSELHHYHNEEYSNVYSFNHAFPNHLSYVLDLIKPASVVAVHSDCPETLDSRGAKHYLPIEGKEYELIKGELKEQ